MYTIEEKITRILKDPFVRYNIFVSDFDAMAALRELGSYCVVFPSSGAPKKFFFALHTYTHPDEGKDETPSLAHKHPSTETTSVSILSSGAKSF